MSCTQRVNIEAYRQLKIETSLLIARKLFWADFTLHGALHHSADLIVINNGRGLSELLKEALEANNKYIRKYAETKARKTSSDDQLTDVLGRLIEKMNAVPLIIPQRSMTRHHKSTTKMIHSQKVSSGSSFR